MNNKQIEKVSAAILTSYIALFYLEEAKFSGLFRQSAKKNLNRTIKDLREIESKYFNQIDEIDETGFTDKLTSNQITFLDFLLNKYSFNDFVILQEICVAYDLDYNRLKGISDKILIENGAKKI